MLSNIYSVRLKEILDHYCDQAQQIQDDIQVKIIQEFLSFVALENNEKASFKCIFEMIHVFAQIHTFEDDFMDNFLFVHYALQQIIKDLGFCGRIPEDKPSKEKKEYIKYLDILKNYLFEEQILNVLILLDLANLLNFENLKKIEVIKSPQTLQIVNDILQLLHSKSLLTQNNLELTLEFNPLPVKNAFAGFSHLLNQQNLEKVLLTRRTLSLLTFSEIFSVLALMKFEITQDQLNKVMDCKKPFDLLEALNNLFQDNPCDSEISNLLENLSVPQTKLPLQSGSRRRRCSMPFLNTIEDNVKSASPSSRRALQIG